MVDNFLVNKVASRRQKVGKIFEKADYIYKLAAEEIAFRTTILPSYSRNIFEFGAKGGLLKREVADQVEFNSYLSMEICNDLEKKQEIVKRKFDLIFSNLTMHLFEDLKLELIKQKFLLEEKGFLIFTIYGPNSLKNLKKIFLDSEVELKNEVNNRFWELRNAEQIASVIQSCGFKECIIDSINQEVEYKSFKSLHNDLKIMGDNSHHLNGYLGKSLYQQVKKKFEEDPIENFEIITVTASN